MPRKTHLYRIPSRFLAIGLLMLPLTSWTAQGAEPKPRKVTIPFETERAAGRGDRSILKLNDDATIIPAHRVTELPIVDGRMGEHVKLDGMVELHFPYGRILSAKTEFHPYLPSAVDPKKLEPNPAYRNVAKFDSALGTVCARTPGSEAEMRINKEQAVSLVRVVPAAVAADSQAKAYHVTTVLDVKQLNGDPAAESLYRDCQNGTRRPQIVKN